MRERAGGAFEAGDVILGVGGIDGKINALALLASGKQEYAGLVRDSARQVGPPDLKLTLAGTSGMASWHWGYSNLFLTEYYLATGDREVLPSIREYSVSLAKGQSGVGSWGHGTAWPELNAGKLHGSLGGYGALNQAGLVCHLSLALARKCGVKDKEVEKQLSYEEIKPLLPAIHKGIVEPAPSGVMFASGIRLRGLELLARHRIKEGLPLCLEVMDIEKWGKRHRITECLKILRSHGGAAKAVLPQLRELEQKLLNHREAKGLKPQIDLARKTIAEIEAAKAAPQLRGLDLPGRSR